MMVYEGPVGFGSCLHFQLYFMAISLFLSHRVPVTRPYNGFQSKMYEGGEICLIAFAVAFICTLSDIFLFFTWIFCLSPIIKVILREAFLNNLIASPRPDIVNYNIQFISLLVD